MVLAQFCDVCGTKFARDISKFCAFCGEKRIVQEAVRKEKDLEVEDEGSMGGLPAALQDKNANTQEAVRKEEDLEVEDEGSMGGLPVALQDKNANTVSYTQVFAPPVCRNKNKKYGKRALLAANMGIQHRIMLDNYRQVKKWVVDAQEVGRLPQGAFSLEEQGVQESLRQIIKENCSTLQEIKLGTKNQKWDEREIYKFLKHHIRYLRRKKRIAENLTRNEVNEGVESNELQNDGCEEESRDVFLMDTVEV